MRKLIYSYCVILVVMTMGSVGISDIWAVAEPSMADYTAYPVFMTSQVQPNIMVLLDNSGSMNYNAYGAWVDPKVGYVTDDPYPCNGSIDVRVYDLQDDAEQSAGYYENGCKYDNNDLDLGNLFYGAAAGSVYDASFVGLRFQNLSIPKNALITKAYLEFTADQEISDRTAQTSPADTAFLIKGEAADHAPIFIKELNGISKRATTIAKVTWNNVAVWKPGASYQTPDLSAIVQEIVNRKGWNSGQAIAFIITGTGKRDAKSRDDGYDYSPRLHIEYTGNIKEYYGYFDPKARYSYSSGNFSRDSDGPWSGNFLNWLTMRRIDVARKVLMGGLAEPRTYAGTQKLTGENSPANRSFMRQYDGRQCSDETPYKDGIYTYLMQGNTLHVYPSTGALRAKYSVVVEKDAGSEPQEFADMDGSGLTTVGIFQRFGNNGRWGNMWFNKDGADSTANGNGGVIFHGITGKVTAKFINDFQNTAADTWTPLAEAFYTATQYFAQKPIDDSLNYANNTKTTQNDPFVGSEYCAKNFVLLITDGASTKDAMIPSDLKHYADKYDTFVTSTLDDCDESTACKYGSGGTDYLKDVALWARTTDLRADIKGQQNIILYSIYAFGNEDNAKELLKEASKNGGFVDRNGNNLPDGGKNDPAEARKEWDADADGVPDTYFEAENGSDLQTALGNAIAGIMERASSGSASSVLATSSEGEATLLQAYFKPMVYESDKEIKWVGYLSSLWLDYCGNLREDSDGDQKLDLGDGSSTANITESPDLIVEYHRDDSNGETYARRYTTHPLYLNSRNCDAALDNAAYETIALDEVRTLFDAGKRLAEISAADRNIFTYIDQNQDNAVNPGEQIDFKTANNSLLAPYLGVANAIAYRHLGSSHLDRINNLINYIRGVDQFDEKNNPILRPRTLAAGVWKLGDIVHSTPVSVSKPMDNYNLIYSDKSYQKYYDKAKGRENVVLVGANDGMLHAFTSGKYDAGQRKFEQTVSGERLGSEIWAYIPQNLLPHLKWLADPDYTHVYYVDLQLKVGDAKILPDTDNDGEPEWGTFVLIGLNMGGKQIWSNEFVDASGNTVTRYFNPSYSCINITNPRTPQLMWERDYTGLGLSASVPNVIKAGDKWMAVFGSGPTNYSGISTQKAHVFVVDLATGAPVKNGANDWLHELAETNAYLNSPVSIDYGLNYNVDGIYFGQTYCEPKNDCSDPDNYNMGMAYKMSVKCDPCAWNSSDTGVSYAEDPALWPAPVVLLKSGTATVPPITGTMVLSTDTQNNVWVYFGSGRFMCDSDKSSIQQNYLFGVKDPFFNKKYSGNSDANLNCYHNYTLSKALTPADLFNSDSVMIATGNTGARVFSGSTLYKTTGDWNLLVSDVQDTDGWRRSLNIDTSVSERCISKPSLLGGIVLTPTFTPNPDACSAGGTTNYYALYYETGTAYKKHIFPTARATIAVDGKTLERVDFKLPGSRIGTPPPASGVHVGRQAGATAFVQLSTGEILEVDFETALPIRSRMTNWRLGE